MDTKRRSEAVSKWCILWPQFTWLMNSLAISPQHRCSWRQCCGSGSRMRISSLPDPGSASKNQSILTQKLFLSSRKYDLGCSFRIRILIFTHPGSRIQGSKRHRIPDPDPQHWLADVLTLSIVSSKIKKFISAYTLDEKADDDQASFQVPPPPHILGWYGVNLINQGL